MTEIHNAELTQEIVIGAVAAWLEQTNDSALSIDVSFNRDINHNSNQDLIACTKIDILKAEDFRPMKRGQHMWLEDDQKMIDEMPRRGSDDVENGVAELVKESFEKWTKSSSAEFSSPKQSSSSSSKWSDEVVKRVAVKWELPSAEYYPVRYEEHIRRNLNIRKSCGELETAQEAPAVREKGEANDRTDQDCLTHPHDLHSSKESLTEAPTQQEKSPEKKEKEREKRDDSPPIKPIEEKVPEKVPEEPKKVEEVKKVEEKPKKEEEKKEELPPKVEEKKEEVKVVEEKKQEPPVVVAEEKKPKKKIQINVKRYPDSGELTILSEKDGIVSFSCSTQHRVKRSKKIDK